MIMVHGIEYVLIMSLSTLSFKKYSGKPLLFLHCEVTDLLSMALLRIPVKVAPVLISLAANGLINPSKCTPEVFTADNPGK